MWGGVVVVVVGGWLLWAGPRKPFAAAPPAACPQLPAPSSFPLQPAAPHLEGAQREQLALDALQRLVRVVVRLLHQPQLLALRLVQAHSGHVHLLRAAGRGRGGAGRQ